ncbi:MAG: membrane dipeptidase, partial [Myxococcales bacterium]|nr:membrane dipeptidase [Myxococcales bacterium]
AAGRARSKGITEAGRRYVRRLNEKNVFVDLAHISREGFWEVLEVHDKKKPAIVTHTGIDSVYPHWRNIDDRQVLAIAESGGTIGIMYHGQFLDGPYLGGKADAIVDHLARIVEVAGEDYASLGSDWDGAISTPRDMPTCLELPVLVERMLRRGWSGERIGKILGGNALRAIERLRG